MKRLEDFEAMKGLTIILVVIAHITRMFTSQGVVPISYSPTLEVLTNFIYIFHMPAFVALSGAVYYFVKRDKKKYNNTKQFVFNKIKRLIIPFIFFSVMIVLPTLLYLELRTNIIDFILKDVVLGDSGTHLWYSVMIFFLFVLFNSVEKYIYNNGVMSWVIFTVFNIFSFMIPNILQATNVLLYMVFFYAGYWFQKNRKKAYPVLEDKSVILVVISVTIYFSLFHSTAREIFMLKQILQLFGGLNGTVMLYVLSDKISESWVMKNWLFRKIIKSSYGIYLVHPMIVYLISSWEQDINMNSFLLVILNLLVVLFTSMLLIKLMRILKLQLFIGENILKKNN